MTSSKRIMCLECEREFKRHLLRSASTLSQKSDTPPAFQPTGTISFEIRRAEEV